MILVFGISGTGNTALYFEQKVEDSTVQPLKDSTAQDDARPFFCLFAGVIGGANLAGFGVTASTKTHKVTDLTGAGAFVLSAAACAW